MYNLLLSMSYHAENTYLIKNVLKDANTYNREKEYVKIAKEISKKWKTDVKISSLDLLK